MFRRAFTMLELVMVIVILGIVSSIGADIIANLYENYIKTRAINTLQSQTELVLDQIAKRLTYRIKPTVIARDSTGTSTASPHYITLSSADKNYDTLEWIGKDNESFRGIKNPGWSGFVDIESNETDKNLGTGGFGWIKTSGSDLNITTNIINSLSYAQVDLETIGTQRPAILFKGQDSFDISQYGWSGSEGNYTHKVRIPTGTTGTNILEFVDANDTPITIYEQYDLAWSAYAIVPEGSANDFNLTLKYNYQPWYDENSSQGESTVLIEHASTFRFTQIGETIRIKLCINDANQSGDYNFAFCKERVVF